MKINYWSCSKLADWLRGTPKPLAATSETWNTWEKTAKIKRFRYWLAEEGLDYLQNFIYWPMNRINNIRCYINNRWITKSHTLTSKLKRGQWHDLDTRLLHCVFDELINFVEIELAWTFAVSSDEKYKTPWYATIFRLNFWRSPEAGVAYLKWASELKFDENDPNHGQPTPQALAAQETLALYLWWKNEWPSRPDPSNISNSSNHNKDKCNIEKEQYEEDTAMLTRLVKNRQNFWT